MSLTAEFRVRSTAFPLVDVAAAVPEMTLKLEPGQATRSGPYVLPLRAAGPEQSFDALETALGACPLVDEFALVGEAAAARLYQLFTTTGPPGSLDELTLSRALPETITVVPDGWRIRQQFADREELATAHRFYRENDIEFELDRLYDTATTDTELIGLSTKQHEALVTARRMGYFGVPRRASMADIAAELDISSSALAERLRRAQSRLVDRKGDVIWHTTGPATPTAAGQLEASLNDSPHPALDRGERQ